MNNLKLGSNNAKMYLGDALISGVEIPPFIGYGSMDNVGYFLPYSKTALNTTKSFEIMGCFYIGDKTILADTGGAICGTSAANQLYCYPSISVEIDSTSKTTLHFRVSGNGSSWNLVDFSVAVILTSNSFHYVKIQHDETTHSTRCYFGTDPNNLSMLTVLPFETPSIFNSVDYSFGWAGNGRTNNVFPSLNDFHLCIDKCKIVSEGNVIFGYDN